MYLEFCQVFFGNSFSERAFSAHFGMPPDVAELIWKYMETFDHNFTKLDLLYLLFYFKTYLPFEVRK